MEGLVNSFADKSIKNHYSNVLNKVRTVLRSAQKEKLEILDSKIKLQLPSCAINDFEYLTPLQTAISTKAVVELDYKKK